MAQLTKAMRSPNRTRKIQSSPTLDTRNLWQRTEQTGSKEGTVRKEAGPKCSYSLPCFSPCPMGALMVSVPLNIEHPGPCPNLALTATSGTSALSVF